MVATENKVKLKDIANELGVTMTTVHRALNDKPDISEKTKKAVLELVDKYNYTPNKIARSLSLKKNLKIGVIIQSMPEFFWKPVFSGMMDINEEIKEFGVELIIKTLKEARNSKDILTLMDELHLENVDAIAMVPVDDNIISSKIDILSSKGIKIATFNDDVENSTRIFYVGPQMERSGRAVADLMGVFLNNSGKVIVLHPDAVSLDLGKRVAGFTDLIRKKYKNIHIDTIKYRQSFQENLSQSFLDMLKTKSFDGIYCSDGYTLPIIGKVIKDNYRDAKKVIMGHEISDETADLINEGIIQATVSQDPYSQGYYVLKYLFDNLLTGKLPKCERMYTRLDIIMKENMAGNDCIINKHY